MKTYFQKRQSHRKIFECPGCRGITTVSWKESRSRIIWCPHCKRNFPYRIDPASRCISCRRPVPATSEQGAAEKRVCPFCGTRQAKNLEFRTIHSEKLTEHALLLFHAGKGLPMKECRAICRSITPDTPYRIRIKELTPEARQLQDDWNALGGTAVRCFDDETSRRPYVELRSFDRMKRWQYVHLMMRYHELCNCEINRDHRMTTEEGQQILARIADRQEAGDQQGYLLRIPGETARCSAFVDEWQLLGGYATIAPECANAVEVRTYRSDSRDDFRSLLMRWLARGQEEADRILDGLYGIDRSNYVTFRFRDRLDMIPSFIAEWRAIGGVAVRSDKTEVR